ncbi:MAG: glycine zipper family protein [Dinoroseobacter sp.]|nr:glycine zipper family protein [Dinoroseobacter sp.]
MICRKPAIFFVVPFLLSACANSGANYVPVIDGAVGPSYESDLAQCQGLAASQAQVDGRTATAVATGAGVAGASSVIFNDNSDNLGRAAAVGAVAGLTSDAIQRNASREAIVRNCMRGRGYNVVG